MTTFHKILHGLLLIGIPLEMSIMKGFGKHVELVDVLLAWWFWWGVKTWALECWHLPNAAESIQNTRVAIDKVRDIVQTIEMQTRWLATNRTTPRD